MKERKRAELFTFTNQATGQRYEAIVSPMPRKMEGNWVRIFQPEKQQLLLRHLTELHGQSFAVLHYLETVSSWDNGIPSAAQVAQDLGLLREAVARCYRELTAAEFLVKVKTRYYLSPLVAWKGTERQWQEACVTLINNQPLPQLPEPRTLAEPRASYTTRRR